MDPQIIISEDKNGEASASYDFKFPQIISVRDKDIEKKLKKIIENSENYKVKLRPNSSLKNGDIVKLKIILPTLDEFNIVNEIPKEINAEKEVQNLYDYDAIYTIDTIDCEINFSDDWFGNNNIDINMTSFAEITDTSPFFNSYKDLSSSSFYKVTYENLSQETNDAKDIKNGDQIEVTIQFLAPKGFKSKDGNNIWKKTFTAKGIKQKINKVESLDASLFENDKTEDSKLIEKQIRAHYGLIKFNMKSFDKLSISEAKYFAGTSSLPFPFGYEDDLKIVKIYEYNGTITVDNYINEKQENINGCVIKFWRNPIYDGTSYYWTENGKQSDKYQIVTRKTLSELSDFGFLATFDDVTDTIKNLLSK